MAQLEHEVEEKPRKKSFFNLDRIFLKMSEVSAKPVDTISVVNDNVVNEKKEALNKAQNEQLEQANQFLNAQLYEYYFAMIKNGYQPNEAQEQHMAKKVTDLIANSQSKDYISTFNDYIKAGFQLNTTLVWKLINNQDFAANIFNHSLFNPNVDYPTLPVVLMQTMQTHKEVKNYTLKDPNVTEEEFAQWQKQKGINVLYAEDSQITGPENVEFYQEFRKILFSDSFSNFAGKKMKTFLKDYVEEHEQNNSISAINFKICKALNPILNFMPHIAFKNVPVNDFLTFITEHNKLFNDEHFQTERLVSNNKKQFKFILNKQYAPAITQILNKTKEVYTNSYFQQKAIQNIYTLAQDYNVQNLPQNTQFLITDIQKNYGVLQKHIDHLSEDQLFNIENLFDKRVPEVLQKYFSIDQEYRESLTNSEGKNALQLMDESLINFNNKFKEIIEDINENKLSDLSATKRYSKTI